MTTQEEVPMHKRIYNEMGQASFSDGKERRAGRMYCLQGPEFRGSDEPRDLFIYDEETGGVIPNSETYKDVARPTEDPEIIAEITRQVQEDLRIREAKLQRAKEYAAGDEVLEELLKEVYVDVDCTEIQSTTTNGISFFYAGSNSSHRFEIGTKDGRKFRRSMAYDDKGNLETRTTEISAEEFKEGGWGYLGNKFIS